MNINLSFDLLVVVIVVVALDLLKKKQNKFEVKKVKGTYFDLVYK